MSEQPTRLEECLARAICRANVVSGSRTAHEPEALDRIVNCLWAEYLPEVRAAEEARRAFSGGFKSLEEMRSTSMPSDYLFGEPTMMHESPPCPARPMRIGNSHAEDFADLGTDALGRAD